MQFIENNKKQQVQKCKMLNKRRTSKIVGSVLVFIIANLLIGWSTLHLLTGGTRIPKNIGSAIIAFDRIPIQISGVLSLGKNYFPPDGVENVYQDIPCQKNPKWIKGSLLISRTSSNGINEILIYNIQNGDQKLLMTSKNNSSDPNYTDILESSMGFRQIKFSSRDRLWHPCLSVEGNLTYCYPWNDLVSYSLVDGKELWRVKGAFHHSIEQDSDGNFWVCAAVENPDEMFEDQAIVKVSKNGKIVEVLKISELLVKSKLEYLVYGSSNIKSNFDPFHLNQITPITNNLGKLRKGDLLVSLRNLSSILIVDPSKKIISWHKSGPWMNQHCVMPFGKSEISVFDNHAFATGDYWKVPDWESKILVHNLETEQTREVSRFENDNFRLRIGVEGRVLPLNNDTWMIEDSYRGTIIIFNKIQKPFIWSNNYPNGKVGRISWCRYIAEESLPRFILN
jgi:hypothetical protein